MKTNEVYGVSNQMIETYITREKVDNLFLEGLQKNKHLIIYGASKQGKTALTNKHLNSNQYVKVNCSTNTSVLDIYNSIVRQLDIEILETKEVDLSFNGEMKAGLKAKIRIPFFAEAQGELGAGVGSTKKESQSFKVVDYNLSLAQDVSELLNEVKFQQRIILENFHYLQEEVQQKLAIDLRIFEDYNILFIILGIWRERNRLCQFNGDLLDRVIEIPVEPWEKNDLKRIVAEGLPLLNVSFNNVIEHIINCCFDSVGVFQEMCKESCYSANVAETSDELIQISTEHVDKAIEKKLADYSSRHIRCLESFIEQTARSSSDIPLYIPYYFIQVLLRESFDEINKGVKRKYLLEKIKEIHHRSNDVRSSDMGYFLKTLVSTQLKKGISPPIFDYDSSTSSVKIIDSTFHFFLRNCDREEVIDDLPVPAGIQTNN